MKFILVFLALFCLAHCQPIINDELGDNSPDEFETHLDTKEVPIEDDAKQDDKHITAQLFRTITCLKCVCSKPNNYGYSSIALCFRCNGKRQWWRVCRGCYCNGHPYGIYDTRYGFCTRCT